VDDDLQVEEHFVNYVWGVESDRCSDELDPCEDEFVRCDDG
jgi:hypothetical protein